MEATLRVTPFGFDRVFHMAGGKSPAADARALNERIDELQADLAAMKAAQWEDLARARADAFEAGLVQARQDREAALLAASDAIHAAIEQFDAKLADTAGEIMRDAADVAFVAAEILAGHAIDHAPVRAIDEALDRVMSQVVRGTRLAIKVHPAVLGDVERLIAERVAQERRQLSITAFAQDTMMPGDALIFWEEGGLAVEAGARRAAVMAELRPILKAKPEV